MTRDNLKLKAVLVLVALFLCNHSVWADDEWDKIPIYNNWTIDDGLKVYSKSASNLSFWNSNAETPDNKKNNRWSSLRAHISLPTQSGNNVYLAALKISNKNSDFANHKYKVYTPSGKEEYITEGGYWYVSIEYKTKSGTTKYWRINYNDGYTGSNYRYNKKSIYIQDNGLNGSWVTGVNEDEHRIALAWSREDGLMIAGYNGESSETTINDVASISFIIVGAGPSVQINGELVMMKQSEYAQAKPYLEQANEQIQNGNYNGAANTMTKVIDNIGYRKAYIVRGYIYTQMEYYKTALEDFNKAVTYATDTDERETAYYYRGICKLCLEDVAGAISDLRNAGQQGRVLINEYELDKYQSTPPAQRRKPTTNTITKPSLTK